MTTTQQTARAALEDLMRRCREDAHTPTYSDLQEVLAKFPTPDAFDGDLLDATRYRWLKHRFTGLSYTSDTGPRPSTPEQRMLYAINAAGKKNTDLIEILLPCFHLGPFDEPIWKDGEHFDYAANMDASIDAAMNNPDLDGVEIPSAVRSAEPPAPVQPRDHLAGGMRDD